MRVLEDNVIFTCVEHILTEHTNGLVGTGAKRGREIYYEVTVDDGDFSIIEAAVDIINRIFVSDYLYKCEMEADYEIESALVTVYLTEA